MRLYYSETSPYARKVRAVAHEKGCHDRLALVPVDTWNLPPALLADNPLGKVPTLVTDAGEVLYDSPVICEYLDTLDGAPVLLPVQGPARWEVLRLQALGDGLMDAAVERFVELARAPERRDTSWLQRTRLQIARVLDCLEQGCDVRMEGVHLGTLSIACALGYLDIRFGELRWRDTRYRLARWSAGWEAMPSMRSTTPRLPAS